MRMGSLDIRDPSRLLVLENNGTLKAMQMRSSFENEPYADYPKDDYYLPSSSWDVPSTAYDMNETADQCEGVSGATMTSRAMAKGIVETARQWERPDKSTSEAKQPWVVWGVSETGSLGVILLAGFSGLYETRKNQFFRRSLQVLLVCYLGLVNGDILSQSLFAGWAQKRDPVGARPILALLTLARASRSHDYGESLLLPPTLPTRSGSAVDGEATQTLLPPTCKAWKVHGNDSFHSFDSGSLRGHHVFQFPFANLEPFDGYVWEVAGGIAIAILLISLIAPAFVPMAYCRYGCPTGAVLKLFEFGPLDNGRNGRDYFQFRSAWAILAALFFS